ncbi:hypothetical protein UFOVP600_29 [uncultured Caudovirales phage]|uniref:Uncharacterized protein n=1 Tax=uncultured Caudovirales phage TaxID=2100421 RepID=A0A6J5MWP9_9CAUD|nr:hypothetical protein UFOVP600_29 [uncultured Caudovirales phage]
MKRNITGIFIFEDKEPTCFEECREETQDKYLENLDKQMMMNLSKKLAKTINDIANQFDLQA